MVPFFVAVDPRRLAPARVQVWATAFSTREAAAAHARLLSEPCIIVEAPHLTGAVQQARHRPGPGDSPPADATPT